MRCRGIADPYLEASIPCQLSFASNLSEATRMLEEQAIELLITDVNLPDGKGTELLPLLCSCQPAASAIVITADPSMDGAIAAMREGALDFLPKPFTRENLVNRVNVALRRQAAGARKDAFVVRVPI